MHSVRRDLRYGVRLLRNAPGFTLLALAALALGLGATTAIFSVVDAVLLQPPYPHTGRLLVVWEKNPGQNQFKMLAAGGNFLAWREQSHTLQSLAAYQEVHVNLTRGPQGRRDAEELPALRISAGLLPLLGVQPLVGRFFRPDEDQPGRTNSALLSYPLWRRFGADPAIAGKSILLDGKSYTIVGVMPPDFRVMASPADVWIPLGLDPADSRTNHSRFLIVLAAMRPGVAISQVRAELDTLGDRLAQADPELNRGWRPSVFSLREEVAGPAEKPLEVLMGAVGFLLLMACVNVANLLLARGSTRRREIAIRMAMGAGRARIAAQLLSESLLLAFAGGALGLLLGWGAIALVRNLGPATMPRLADARLDWRLFLFAFAASIVTGLLCGVAPALQSSGAELNSALVEAGRGRTASRSGRLLRSALVTIEVALAVLVLIGATLLIRSFARLRGVDLGFQPAGLLTLRLPLAGDRNAKAERRVAFVQQVEDRVSALPGMRAVAAVDTLPLGGFGFAATFAIEGRPVPADKPIALVRGVTPGYFRTAGLPLLEGRDFNSADTRDVPLVMIASRNLARRFWPTGGALGSHLLLDPNNRRAAIVGVAGDVKPETIEGEDWLTLYCPYSQNAFHSMTLVLRSALPGDAALASAAGAIRQLDPEQPVADPQPMERMIDRAVAGARFNTVLLAIFAQIAFVLAAVGVYGVVSYDVSRRTGEIGLRLALGALPANVLRMVLRQAVSLAALGIAVGLAAAWGLTRLMATMLFGVGPTDPVTFLAIPVLLGTVVIFAGYLPARRAMALDPAMALRHE
ncbi:MAG TPA: ABC transporter permease [Bryobacteraceae bacterium]|jgi:putative ABC transport system permease protein|nr:ABC transporter permease [Bryobacteraceae bacterium]